MNEQSAIRPYIVGRYENASGVQFLPLTIQDIDRSIWFYRRVLDTYQLPERSFVLVISNFEDAALTTPLERCLIADGHIPTNAEATQFDAARSESFLRRLKVPAAAGVTSAVLDGLEALGFDPLKLFTGLTIWARGEDAYQRLQNSGQFTVRRWMEIGPAPTMECRHGGGLHIDTAEWVVERNADSEIVLTSRRPRAQSFIDENTGIKADIVTKTCACGFHGPRILPS